MSRVLKIFIIFSMIFFAGCDFGNKNVLRVATNADFPPYVFKTGKREYAGIDIEIAKEVAKRLGLEVKFRDMPFDRIINHVSDGKADIGICGFTVIEERKKSVNFSKTYDTSKQVIVVRENSDIKSINDLYDKNIRRKVAVQHSTTSEMYFNEDIKNKGLLSNLLIYEDVSYAIPELLKGEIDCIIRDEEVAKNYVLKNKGLKILSTEYTNEEYAIVVNKDELKLLDGINMVLEDMKLDGTIEKIRSKYIK